MLDIDRAADPHNTLEAGLDPRVDPPHHSTECPAGPGRLAWVRERWVGLAVFIGCGVLLFLAFLGQAGTAPASSESSGQALQAWDMLHGNLLLHGWSLSDVSFYTTELPEYMLVEVVHGLNVQTVHVAAALSYTLTLLLAVLLAKGRATGREATVRMLIAGGIILAPSLGTATQVLVGDPDHMGTHVPLLIIYLVLDRVRPRWWVPLLVAALLTWAQIADTLVLFEGALPLALACAIRICRRRGAIGGRWYEAMLAGGAVVSAVAARVVLHLINAAGGFYVKTPVAEFKTFSRLLKVVGKQLVSVLNTFGADFSGPPAAPFPALVHLIGLLLVLVALCIAVRRLWRDNDLIVQMLCIAFLLVFAAYLASTNTHPNEIVGLLPIGAALAGRVLGGRIVGGQVVGGRDADGRVAGGRIVGGRLPHRGLIPALAVVLAGSVGIMIYNASRPPAPNPSVPLATWLQAHHLDYGLAGFWSASIETVASGDHIQVRPVRLHKNQLVAAAWESDASWYDPHLHYANFVIAPPSQNCPVCLGDAIVTKEYGPPATTYHVEGNVIMVWNKNLLEHLPDLFWCGPSWPWRNPSTPSRQACG
jgi:hypothetical protein